MSDFKLDVEECLALQELPSYEFISSLVQKVCYTLANEDESYRPLNCVGQPGSLLKLYEEDEDLLEDVVIEYKQAHEMADVYANIVSTTTDAYASIISNNMNDIMKVLAAATIVLTIPDLIGCFFGQNFPFFGSAFHWHQRIF